MHLSVADGGSGGEEDDAVLREGSATCGCFIWVYVQGTGCADVGAPLKVSTTLQRLDVGLAIAETLSGTFVF